MFSRGQLHQQCCEEWTLVSEETQAKMARMAAAAAWGLGNYVISNPVSAKQYSSVWYDMAHIYLRFPWSTVVDGTKITYPYVLLLDTLVLGYPAH